MCVCFLIQVVFFHFNVFLNTGSTETVGTVEEEERQLQRKTNKRKYMGLYSRLEQAGICEGVPITDRPFKGKLDPSTF